MTVLRPNGWTVVWTLSLRGSESFIVLFFDTMILYLIKSSSSITRSRSALRGLATSHSIHF